MGGEILECTNEKRILGTFIGFDVPSFRLALKFDKPLDTVA